MDQELQPGEVREENWSLNVHRSLVLSGFSPYPSAEMNPEFVFEATRSSSVDPSLNQDLVHRDGRLLHDHYSHPTVMDSGKNYADFDIYTQTSYPTFPFLETTTFEYATSSSSSSFPSFVFNGDSSYIANQDQYYASLGMINSTALPENHLQLSGAVDFPVSFPHSNQPQFFNSSTHCTQNANQLNFSSQNLIEENNTPRSKRPRTETRTPIPNFKARKEKLGGRITTLQQLVSPFGKTDTASVLDEAIECIRFLQDQVNVLSAPYFKSKPPPLKIKDREEGIRSRGLCLVPISSTYCLVPETSSDLWTPAFSGSFK